MQILNVIAPSETAGNLKDCPRIKSHAFGTLWPPVQVRSPRPLFTMFNTFPTG